MTQQLGKVPYLTNEDYHANPAIGSSSVIKLIKKSPLHYKASMDRKEPQTEAMKFGQAFHSAILEVEKFKENYVERPEGMSFVSKEGKSWRDAQTKEILTFDQFADLRGMFASVYGSSLVAPLLSGGDSEQSYFWKDEATDLICKCRPDYLNDMFMVDLKSTEDASEYGWTSSKFRWKYDIQAQFYMRGLKACTGIDYDFKWIVVEKAYPYAVAVYEMTNEEKVNADTQIDQALSTIKMCQDLNTWPGYDDRVRTTAPVYFGI